MYIMNLLPGYNNNKKKKTVSAESNMAQVYFYVIV